MKDSLFIQYTYSRDSVFLGKPTKFYENGFSSIWDIAKPTWVDQDEELTIQPGITRVYASVWQALDLVKTINLAKKYRDIQFFMGGPFVNYATPAQKQRLVVPPNLRAVEGTIEELLGLEHNPSRWKVEIPDRKDYYRVYSFYIRDSCTWGRCTFCSSRFMKNCGDRAYDITRLREAPAGGVWLAAPDMDDISFLPNLDYSNKQYHGYLRGGGAEYDKLREVIPKVPAEKLSFTIGVEFPSNRMLRHMRKGLTVESLIKVINYLYDSGAYLLLTYITGWDNLIPEDIEEAKQFFGALHDQEDKRTRHRRSVLCLDKGDVPVIGGDNIIWYMKTLSGSALALDTQWCNMLRNRPGGFMYSVYATHANKDEIKIDYSKYTPSDKLSTYNRLIPREGLEVYPGVRYVDATDTDPETRNAAKKFFFADDKQYTQLLHDRKYIYKGSSVGRRYCVYIFKGDDVLGNIVFTELLDNPHGFGDDDFAYSKYIYPKYQRTKYSRYALSDLMHFFFKSGLAKRLYAYVPAPNSGKTFWERVDRSLPCMSELYTTDGPELQTYISVKESFRTPVGNYDLIEFDGKKYNEMDLFKYFMTSPGRDEETVRRWMKEMDEAAEHVRITV
jgi:RimJ/RimL family protein N-acetyltransferase